MLEKLDDEAFCKVYEPLALAADVCPICYVSAGELHVLGCPVEVCPWCGGQLTKCHCRFSQLDMEQISAAAHVERLREKLEEKGRIAYSADQRPGYPAVEGSK